MSDYEHFLEVGLTGAERELGLCEDVLSVRSAWDRLYDLGIRGHAVTGGGPFAALRMAAVVFLPGGHFEFGHNLMDATGAVVAAIVPMLDEAGRTQNLLACDFAFKRAARWRSTLPILGMDRLYLPRLEPLHVFRNVLDWLRAGRQGIVLLDNHGAAKLLCDGEPLAVDDIAFGRELAAKLHIGPPRIVIRDTRRAA